MFSVRSGKQTIKSFTNFQDALKYATDLASRTPLSKKGPRQMAVTPTFLVVEE